MPTDITPLIETLRARLKESGAKEAESSKEQSEVGQAVHLLIRLAVQLRASGIHIVPQPNGVAIIRYRLDGALQSIAQFDLRLLPAVIKQWKTLAEVMEVVSPTCGAELGG